MLAKSQATLGSLANLSDVAYVLEGIIAAQCVVGIV